MTGPGHAIVREVADARGIVLPILLSPCRTGPLVDARAEAARRMRSELGYSLPRIGRLLQRDHTTVLYWLRDRRRSGSIAEGV